MSVRVAVDATPLLGQPTGVGAFVAGALAELRRRPGDVDLVPYGLTWRGRAEIGELCRDAYRAIAPASLAALIDG